MSKGKLPTIPGVYIVSDAGYSAYYILQNVGLYTMRWIYVEPSIDIPVAAVVDWAAMERFVGEQNAELVKLQMPIVDEWGL